jgi:transglutaminase-like putative cysteine protease
MTRLSPSIPLLALALGAALAACVAQSSQTGTPTGTASVSLAAASATPTVPWTSTPAATSTPTATMTPLPTATPTATSTSTSTPTATATPTFTPSPTPTPAHRYEMAYEIEHPTVLGQEVLVEQLWMPLPNDDGDGTRDVELLEIYPDGYEILDIGAANQAAYWGNVPDLCERTDCRFGVRFLATLERPQYAIPWRDEVTYDTEGELYQAYTRPERGIESDDPKIRELALQIVGDERNVYKFVLLLQSWVQQNVLYPDLGSQYPDDALMCIDEGLGDCAGQSKVFVALCRALGIPARTVSGLRPFARGVGQLEEFGQRATWFESTLDVHVWVEVYFPDLGWVQGEPDMPGYGISRERLTVRRGPFALQGGLCRQATYFHLPLAVRGDWCGQSVGWEVSIDSRLVE